jgi:hypothetical protein
VIAIGAAVTFLLYARTTDPARSAAIGFFYALVFVGVFHFISRKLSHKLTVFPSIQQWILRAALFAIGLSAAYLLGIVFQTLMLMPMDTLIGLVVDRFWKGFVYLISLPFDPGDQTEWLDAKMRSVVITFFTVLFLIGLVSMVISLVELRWREERLKRAVAQAELSALRAQMDPHFLFNTLNTIASLIKKEPDQAEALLVQLSHMLRYIFRHSGAQIVQLDDELIFTQQFIDLLKARFGGGLQVTWQTHLTSNDVLIPPLLLQPLVENAVHHGRLGLEGPLRLTVTVEQTDRAIFMTVTDNGVGMSPEKRANLPVNGHALANMADRLALYYGQNDLMTIDTKAGQGTIVSLRLPL